MNQIHPTAVIDPKAQLGNGVKIGPLAVIGPHVVLADNVEIGPHAVIDGWTEIGAGCRIFPAAMVGQITQDLKYKGEKTFVRIGEGTVIRECVTINSGTGENSETRIGSKCLLMAYAHVAHNCVVHDHVIIANCGTLAGHVEVHHGAVIGGLSAVHQFCRIGRLCIVGGCSKVVQDTPPFLMVDGHPAKAWGLNAVGLRRHGMGRDVCEKLKKVFRIVYRSGYSITHAVKVVRNEFPDDPHASEFLDFISSARRGIC